MSLASWHTGLCAGLDSLRDASAEFCDVTLRSGVGGERVAHACVLAAASARMHALLRLGPVILQVSRCNSESATH